MGIEAGEVNMISNYQNVADYLIANNDKFEVAKRSGKNVEVVNIANSARAAALSSGQIDVIFWVVVPDGDKFPADIDTPENVELSAPYFKDSVAHLKLKDSK